LFAKAKVVALWLRAQHKILPRDSVDNSRAWRFLRAHACQSDENCLSRVLATKVPQFGALDRNSRVTFVLHAMTGRCTSIVTNQHRESKTESSDRNREKLIAGHAASRTRCSEREKFHLSTAVDKLVCN